MTTLQIDVQPQKVNLLLYAGDGTSVKFILTDGPTAEPLPVTGTVMAQIRLDRLSPDPPIVSFAVDLSEAADGIVYCNISAAQTRSLVEDASAVNGRFTGVWDVQWTPSTGLPRTLVQGKVECIIDVSR